MSEGAAASLESRALSVVAEIERKVDGKECEDDFAPAIENESADFLLPENQVTVHFDPQPFTNTVKSFSFKPGPLYLTTCYEEFSRNYIYVAIGKRIKNRLDLTSANYEKIGRGDFSPQSILQCYNPGYDYWYSTFKKGPCSIGHILTGKSAGDTHVLLRINRCLVKQRAFEPVFGSIVLYTFLNDEIHRLCEAFYFDATPDSVKSSYRFFYSQDLTDRSEIRGTSINIAEASGSTNVNFNKFLTFFPEELRLKDVFMVVQLSKILTTDGDKAIAPYLKQATPVDSKKNIEASERLSRFRQPLGFAISKLFDESGKVIVNPNSELTLSFHAQKVCLNDFAIGQVIKEMFPTDGVNPYYRFEAMDIELRMNVYDVGGPDCLRDRMQELGIFDPAASTSAHNNSSSSNQAAGSSASVLSAVSTSNVTASIVARSSSRAQKPSSLSGPHFLDSQVMSNSAQIALKSESVRLDHLGKQSGRCAVRKVLPLISPAFPWAKSVSRQLKCGVENTLFVYPIQFDRFPSSYRNLCAKIELIELKSNIQEKRVPSAFTPHTVLESIYNHACITGDLFVSEAYTRVSYHTKNPSTNDEFKIRLPDVLTSRHWIKFSIYHVHVKLQANRGSLLSSIIRPSIEKEESDSVLVGTGFLPLMLNGEHLLADEEHLVLLPGSEQDVNKIVLEARESPDGSYSSLPPSNLNLTNDIPSIRVRTRSFCSLVSMDRRVHNLLKNNPISLGYLPSSIMPLEVAARICYKSCDLEPKEPRLVAALAEITKATNLELTRYFMVIFRLLIRALLGGTGSYDETYINPFMHPLARSQAFLTMLTLFDKIFGEIGNSIATNEMSRERQVLDVCVDYLLDEEVPVPEEELRRVVGSYLIATAPTGNEDPSTPPALSTLGSPTIQPFSPSHLTQLMIKKESFVVAKQGLVMESPSQMVNEIVDDGDNKEVPGAVAFDVVGIRRGARAVSEAAPESAPEPVSELEVSSLAVTMESVGVPFTDSMDEIAGGSRTELEGAGDGASKKQVVSRVTMAALGEDSDDEVLDKEVGRESEKGTDCELEAIQNSVVTSRAGTDAGTGANAGANPLGTAARSLSTPPMIPSSRPSSAMDEENAIAASVHSSPETQTSPSDLSNACLESEAKPRGIAMLETGNEDEDEEEEEEEEEDDEEGMEACGSSHSLVDASVERRSWGGYITESLWGSGRLAPSTLHLRSPSSEQMSSDANAMSSEEIAEQLIDDIAHHMVLQVGRLIEERLIHLSVHAIAQTISGSSSGSNASGKASGNKRSSCVDPLSEQYILAGKRFHLHAAAYEDIAAGSLPFDSERQWFQAIDQGLLIDDADLFVENVLPASTSIGMRTASGRLSYETTDATPPPPPPASPSVFLQSQPQSQSPSLLPPPPPLQTSVSLSVSASLSAPALATPPHTARSDSNSSSSSSSSTEIKSKICSMLTAYKPYVKETLHVSSVEPTYDSLDGYSQRHRSLLAPDPHFAIAKHWWPYLYEVLTTQWVAILSIVNSPSSRSTNPVTQGYSHDFSADNTVNSTRIQIMEHGPILLKMIYKSLTLRIHREAKRPPVILDAQYYDMLTLLVHLLTIDSLSVQSGVWKSRRMVQSLAKFINSLFALVIPKQVIGLIERYFRSLRGESYGTILSVGGAKISTVEEVEQRLLFVQELTYFDHFVAVNFPCTLDSPLSLLSSFPTEPERRDEGMLMYTFTGIRYRHCPSPYSLAHLVIQEVLRAYRMDNNKRTTALDILRDLLVRHAYDSRYQRADFQQRVCVMYLPFVYEIVHKECDRILNLKYDSVERKEILSLFTYIVCGIPSRLQRHVVRQLCGEGGQSSCVNLSGASSSGHPSSDLNLLNLLAPENTPMRILSLKRDTTLSTPEVEAYLPKSTLKGLAIYQLILLLHMMLDTFEQPRLANLPAGGTTSSTVNSTLSLSGAASSAAAGGNVGGGTGGGGGGMGVSGKDEAGHSLDVLSPKVVVENTLFGATSATTAGLPGSLANGGNADGEFSQMAAVGSGVTSGVIRRTSGQALESRGGGGGGGGGAANALLANLDNRLQRKVANTVSRKSTGGGGASGAGAGAGGGSMGGGVGGGVGGFSVLGAGTGGGATGVRKSVRNGTVYAQEERRWAEHVRKMSKEATRINRVSMKSINRSILSVASTQLSSMTARTVLSLVNIMLDECPTLLTVELDIYDIFGSTGTFILRDCNIEDSMLAGINPHTLKLIPFIRMLLCILLHMLYENQSSEVIVDVFVTAISMIRKFGAKTFLIAMEDSLQYWLRTTLFHCGYHHRGGIVLSRSTASASVGNSQDAEGSGKAGVRTETEAGSKQIRAAACDFLLSLMRTCTHYFGSFTLISTTALAVISDAIAEILDYHRGAIRTYTDEDHVLTYLVGSIDSMRVAARSHFQSTATPLRTQAHSLSPNSYSNAFCSSLIAFCNDLDLLILAHGDMRRYVTHPVGYDFFGANLLDGPFDSRTIALVQAIRTRRRVITNEQNSATKAGFHIEEVMARFVAASEVYDAFKLPRFRMFWLENLARLHELCGNRAEGAEIRWRIFALGYQLQESWMKLWAPRPPLPWIRRGGVISSYDHCMVSNNMDRFIQARSGGGGAGGSAGLPASSAVSCFPPGDDNRNFYTILMTALDAKPFHPWYDRTQFTTHMITALTVATERFCSTNLVHLAERASGHLINLYRLAKKAELMVGEYSRMVTALKSTAEKGITTSIAMGTFYRVYYEGLGVPEYLRGKEFIFRNANHLHVSEFHTLVINHLKAVVAEGVEVKMISDATTATVDRQEAKAAYLIMNSVKLIMNKGHTNSLTHGMYTKYNMSTYASLMARGMAGLNGIGSGAGGAAPPPSWTSNAGGTGSFGSRHSHAGSTAVAHANTNVESLNQVLTFQYSVPFTVDGSRAQAKKMEDQCLRTNLLMVKEPFPYILTRQQVCYREVRVFLPIEVSILDIEDRIEAMESELLVEAKSQAETNNLMRLVQGTVLPQVNAGAAEVAKVFLSPSRVHSEQMHAKMKLEATRDVVDEQERKIAAKEANLELEKIRQRVIKLKVTLLCFLICSKHLLLKSRRVLISDASLLDQSPLLNDGSSLMHPLGNAQLGGGGINQTTSMHTSAPPSGLMGGGSSPASGLATPLSAGQPAGNSAPHHSVSSAPAGSTGSSMMSRTGLTTLFNAAVSATGGNSSRRQSTSEAVALTTANVNANNNSLSGGGGASGLGGGAGGGGMSGVGGGANVGMGGGAAGQGAGTMGGLSQVELGYVKWQNEMERGFEALVTAIYPFIAELREAEMFSPTRLA